MEGNLSAKFSFCKKKVHTELRNDLLVLAFSHTKEQRESRYTKFERKTKSNLSSGVQAFKDGRQPPTRSPVALSTTPCFAAIGLRRLVTGGAQDVAGVTQYERRVNSAAGNFTVDGGGDGRARRLGVQVLR
jgi:hypothetical protein